MTEELSYTNRRYCGDYEANVSKWQQLLDGIHTNFTQFQLVPSWLVTLLFGKSIQDSCFASSIESNHQDSHFWSGVSILGLNDAREAVPFLPNKPDNNFETSKLVSGFERKWEKRREKHHDAPSMKTARRAGGDLLDNPISHRVSIQTCTKRKRRWFGTPGEMLVKKTLRQEKGGARTNLFYYVWEMRTPKRGTKNLTLHIFPNSDTN